MEQVFDFNGVESPVALSYLNPGEYPLVKLEGTYTASSDTVKTPFLSVNFNSPDGVASRKFYITPKTLRILQYLHENITGKKLDRQFKTADEIANYFLKILAAYETKGVKRLGFIVGREVATDGKKYSRVTDFDFLKEVEKDYQGKEYSEEEIADKNLSKTNNYQPQSAPSTNTVIGSSDLPTFNSPYAPVGDSDDLPF